MQSFLHLWVSPDCGHCLLWDIDIYVCAAQVHSLLGYW
jgi:hypothetical protein